MSRRGFTRGQKAVLLIMALAVVGVFGMLGYAVRTTIQWMNATASPSPVAVSPLTTPVSPLPTATPIPSSPTPSPTPTRVVPLSQIQSARAVHEMSRIVARVRQLPPVEQIPVTFPTEQEIAILLLQRYQQERPQEELRFYATLGLIPLLDPLPLPDVGAQAGHALSLYLPAGRQIMLVSRRGPATPDVERALVYALAHATLDRSFDTENLSPCQQTTDAAWALRAVVEGDAMLTTARYAGLSEDAEIQALARLAADALEPSYAPLQGDPLMERLRLFPYLDGMRWVAALYDRGEWSAVNRAYGRLPCSTEQVLHPERYLDEEPVEVVSLLDLGPVLGRGWSRVRQDTLGELLLGLHLRAHLDDEQMAWQAADGWAGDSLALWENGSGQQVILWRIAWDNRDEAEAFARVYGLMAPRFRTPPLLESEAPFDLPGRYWSGPAGAGYLVRAGRTVTVVWGPDAETVTTIAQVLP